MSFLKQGMEKELVGQEREFKLGLAELKVGVAEEAPRSQGTHSQVGRGASLGRARQSPNPDGVFWNETRAQQII